MDQGHDEVRRGSDIDDRLVDFTYILNPLGKLFLLGKGVLADERRKFAQREGPFVNDFFKLFAHLKQVQVCLGAGFVYESFGEQTVQTAGGVGNDDRRDEECDQ